MKNLLEAEYGGDMAAATPVALSHTEKDLKPAPTSALAAALQAAWMSDTPAQAQEASATPGLTRKQVSRKKRRHEQIRARHEAESADVDINKADALISSLLATKEGRKLVPLSAYVLAQAECKVAEEAKNSLQLLVAGLAQRSGMRKTVVTRLCGRNSDCFTISEWERICGVAAGYVRQNKGRIAKGASQPLYECKLAGPKTPTRESTSQTERDAIVEWARNNLVVRSGCHRETFRLTDLKKDLLTKFRAAYPRVLRQLVRKVPSLRANESTKNLTILHRNIERALWLSRQPGFEEGEHADERERVRPKVDKDKEKLPPATLADFDPARWHMIPRSPEWFWETLKAEGLRFRVDRTPYECEICLNQAEEKYLALEQLIASCVERTPDEADVLRIKLTRAEKKRNTKRIHLNQVAKQRTYNITYLEMLIGADIKIVRVTVDFGASYLLDGGRFVDLVMFLKYRDEHGDLATEAIFNIVTDKDEVSEDAYFVRAVWDHHLGTSGVFSKWDHIILVRDSGPHFQNNRVCYFESTIKSVYHKLFEVSAFAKRHGFNECDGLHARTTNAVRDKAMAGAAPRTARDIAMTINNHEKFSNCTAYYFDKIDRNPALFPKIRDFDGITANAHTQFQYCMPDVNGAMATAPGYVRARPISGEGKWQVHDFLPHTRPEAWGKRCTKCSDKLGRPVFHKRPEETRKACTVVSDRPIIQPDSSQVDPLLQPVPRSQRGRDAAGLGPDAVQCSICNKNFKSPTGFRRHAFAKHLGEVHTHAHPHSHARIHTHTHIGGDIHLS